MFSRLAPTERKVVQKINIFSCTSQRTILIPISLGSLTASRELSYAKSKWAYSFQRCPYHQLSDYSSFHSQTPSYEKAADEIFQKIIDLLETSDLSPFVDSSELSGDSVLKITLSQNKEIILLNQHNFCQQIWYSSPFGPPDYFDYSKELSWTSHRTGNSLIKRLLGDLQEAQKSKNSSGGTT